MYYYNNELPPQQGWVCPKCGRVNAPWKSSCDCVSTQTTGTGTAYLVKTSSISRDSHEIAEQTDQSKGVKCPICGREDNFVTECLQCGYKFEQTEPQTDCDKHCVQTEVGCERTDCAWK